MNHFIRNIIGILATGLAMLTGGCTDLLDQRPQGEWIQGDESGGGSFQSDVFTLYAKMRGFSVTGGTTALAVHCFRSEDAEKNSTASVDRKSVV